MTSEEYLNQLQSQYNNAGDAGRIIEEKIKGAYSPTIQQLVQQGNTLEGEYYNALPQAFANAGRGARSIGPAGALANAVANSTISRSTLDVNRALRNLYGTNINDLIGKGLQSWQMGYSTLSDLYNRAFGREQDAWQRGIAERQLALQAKQLEDQKSMADRFQKFIDDWNKRNKTNTGTGVGSSPRNKTGLGSGWSGGGGIGVTRPGGGGGGGGVGWG